MTATIQNTIERTIELPVTRQRAWDAITTPQQISQWFHGLWEFELTPRADPFRLRRLGHPSRSGGRSSRWTGSSISGRMKAKTGCRDAHRRRTEHPDGIPPRRCPYDIRLMVVESAFAFLPDDIRENSLRNNTQGWDEQMGTSRVPPANRLTLLQPGSTQPKPPGAVSSTGRFCTHHSHPSAAMLGAWANPCRAPARFPRRAVAPQ